MDEKFDCIIVGGGIAGLAAAMTLARSNCRFLLVERGDFFGSKNVSGGVLWGYDLAKLVPDYASGDHGCERFIVNRRLTFLDDQSSLTVDFKSQHLDAAPYSGVSVLRSRFDHWLAGKVQEVVDGGECAGDSFLATNVLVDGLVRSGEAIVGITTGGDHFHADCVILAEGVNNLLTRQAGLQDEYVPADHVSIGVKEVIGFDRSVLEDRFQLSGDRGMANEFVGHCSQGISGGGFLYTNRDSVSLGLVLSLADLQNQNATPYDLLTDFKRHPTVTEMIRDGKVVEYSAHVVSSGDTRGMPRDVYGEGVLITGEAAHLMLNSGRAIQGMDCAMRSGILAAETVLEAKARGDFSAPTLKSYRDRLEASYVWKDMHTFQNAVRLLHNPVMHDTLPSVLCDFGRRFFTIDNQPTARASRLLRESVREHSSYWEMAKLAFSAYRAF